jgi:hypothetical protein
MFVREGLTGSLLKFEVSQKQVEWLDTVDSYKTGLWGFNFFYKKKGKCYSRKLLSIRPSGNAIATNKSQARRLAAYTEYFVDKLATENDKVGQSVTSGGRKGANYGAQQVAKGKQSKELKEIKEAAKADTPEAIERLMNKKAAVISRQDRIDKSRRKEALRETYTARSKKKNG